MTLAQEQRIAIESKTLRRTLSWMVHNRMKPDIIRAIKAQNLLSIPEIARLERQARRLQKASLDPRLSL